MSTATAPAPPQTDAKTTRRHRKKVSHGRIAEQVGPEDSGTYRVLTVAKDPHNRDEDVPHHDRLAPEDLDKRYDGIVSGDG